MAFENRIAVSVEGAMEIYAWLRRTDVPWWQKLLFLGISIPVVGLVATFVVIVFIMLLPILLLGLVLVLLWGLRETLLGR